MEKLPPYTQLVGRLLGSGIFKDKKQAVTQIARVLGISQTSVYNKLSERCRFSIEEIILICKKFHLSANELLMPDNVQSNHFTSRHLCADTTQNSLVSHWLQIVASWTRLTGIESTEILLFPQSLPLQHLSAFPQLAYLVLYYQFCHESPMHKPSQPYSPDSFTHHPAVRQAHHQLMGSMKKSTTRELFHPAMLDALLTAYGELCISGIIHDRNHHTMIEIAMEQLITHLETIAEQNHGGSKPGANTFYHQVAVFSNSGMADWMLVQSGDTTPLARYQPALHFATESRDPILYTRLARTFDIKWQLATPITGSGASARKLFFLQIRQKTATALRKAKFASPDPEVTELQWHQVPGNRPEAMVPCHLPEP